VRGSPPCHAGQTVKVSKIRFCSACQALPRPPIGKLPRRTKNDLAQLRVLSRVETASFAPFGVLQGRAVVGRLGAAEAENEQLAKRDYTSLRLRETGCGYYSLTWFNSDGYDLSSVLGMHENNGVSTRCH